MRRSGRVVATLLQDVGAKVRPGVTTLELDQLAGQVLERHGAASCRRCCLCAFPSCACRTTK